MTQANRPRLKLHVNGTLSVVEPQVCRGEASAIALLRLRYGSLLSFARAFNLRPDHVYAAVSRSGLQRAGHVARVRQILGLPSAPTAHALRIAATHHCRQQEGRA